MTILKPLLERNKSWADTQCQCDPHYFENTSQPQQPHSLWIGCSDSRVPAEVLTGSHPGELFVHRNIANMVVEDDDNLQSVLQYALEYLNVSAIILCGHYGCGGVQAASALPDMPLAAQDNALSRRIRLLRQALSESLSQSSSTPVDETARQKQLVEANVLTQFANLVVAEPVLQRWKEGHQLDVFGCVYDLHTGHLKELMHQSAPEYALET
ncbi:carbonic anhydrase [Rouxiella chamberiensis]|uniref:Carbonic anhydrase n=1 Tax=Rouxiella chamberiensis TaxID=1513468 RepID=A0ABY7HMG9_9GAMM|nr:carbonic anhydrase [Rouxiella chamberiensis]WAT00242.1 carbonic anhydrase [Rouxiella chamberiensis]